MNLTFISSPYRGDIKLHELYARLACRDSFNRGEAPFAPHLLYTQPQILDDGLATERERGMQAAYEWCAKATNVAFYIDYGWSVGMLRELRVARLYPELRLEVRKIKVHEPDQILDSGDITAILLATRTTVS